MARTRQSRTQSDTFAGVLSDDLYDMRARRPVALAGRRLMIRRPGPSLMTGPTRCR
jgi:hypothetical protein